MTISALDCITKYLDSFFFLKKPTIYINNQLQSYENGNNEVGISPSGTCPMALLSHSNDSFYVFFQSQEV